MAVTVVSALMALRSWHVPMPLSAQDYIELLPMQARAINSYGVKINHRVYDAEALGPYRGQPSGVAAPKNLWEVHHDLYDVTGLGSATTTTAVGSPGSGASCPPRRSPSARTRGTTPARPSPNEA